MSISHRLTIRYEQDRGGYSYPVQCKTWPTATSPFPDFTIHFESASSKPLIEWKSGVTAIEIISGSIEVTGSLPQSSAVCKLRKGSFPPTDEEGRIRLPSSITASTYMVMTIKIEVSKEEVQVSTKETSVSAFAPAFASTLLARVTSNVCFSFPRTGRQLWINEDVLRKINSPYFETLFSSGFAESSNVDLDKSSSLTYPPYTFEDSDVEQDKQSAVKPQTSKRKDKSTKDGTSKTVPYKTIEILDTTWTTYYAVLCWIGTGHIEFAPLLSTTLYPTSEYFPTSKTSTDPPAASPKSVYRLAHLLELPTLANLALENFESQLTVENAAYELYTDVAANYSASRDITLDFTADHFRQVVGSPAYRGLLEGTSTDQLDGLTGLLLGERLAKKGSFN